jgi:hypothetical protein
MIQNEDKRTLGEILAPDGNSTEHLKITGTSTRIPQYNTMQLSKQKDQVDCLYSGTGTGDTLR